MKNTKPMRSCTEGAVRRHSYDVVCPSDYMIQRMIENDLLAEINWDNIPNIKNIGQTYMDQSKAFDPENKYFCSIAGELSGSLQQNHGRRTN